MRSDERKVGKADGLHRLRLQRRCCCREVCKIVLLRVLHGHQRRRRLLQHWHGARRRRRHDHAAVAHCPRLPQLHTLLCSHQVSKKIRAVCTSGCCLLLRIQLVLLVGRVVLVMVVVVGHVVVGRLSCHHRHMRWHHGRHSLHVHLHLHSRCLLLLLHILLLRLVQLRRACARVHAADVARCRHAGQAGARARAVHVLRLLEECHDAVV